MQIDESRGDDQVPGIQLLVGGAADLIRRRNLLDPAIPQQHIHGRVDLARGIDQVSLFDQQTFDLLSAHPQLPGEVLTMD